MRHLQPPEYEVHRAAELQYVLTNTVREAMPYPETRIFEQKWGGLPSK